MPTPLDVVRPHGLECRLCMERDLAGNPVPTAGHYVCQASECSGLADFTWPRLTDGGTEPVLACQAHTLPAEIRDKPHRTDCPAPDPGCNCTWQA